MGRGLDAGHTQPRGLSGDEAMPQTHWTPPLSMARTLVDSSAPMIAASNKGSMQPHTGLRSVVDQNF